MLPDLIGGLDDSAVLLIVFDQKNSDSLRFGVLNFIVHGLILRILLVLVKTQKSDLFMKAFRIERLVNSNLAV